MTDKNHPVDKVEQALVQVHRTRPQVETDADWTRRVMTRVQKERHPGRPAAPPDLILRLVWRFAAAACTFAFVLVFFALQTGLEPDPLALHMFISDPLILQTLYLFVYVSGATL